MDMIGELEPFGQIEPLEALFGPEWGERELGDSPLRQFLFLRSGSVVVEIDGSERRLRPGSLLILPAYVRCLSKAAKGSRGMWIAASNSLVNGQLMPIMGAPTREYWMSYDVPMLIEYWAGPDRLKARNRVQHELELIRERLQDDCAAAIFAYIYVVLLAEVRRSHLPGIPMSATFTSKSELGIVTGFRGLIERHFREHLPVEGYASIMGITAVRLTRTCRLVTGGSPLELIQERMFREARRELIYSDRSVAEIAYDLGFEEPSYFSRRFKEVVGTTPGEFRHSNRLRA